MAFIDENEVFLLAALPLPFGLWSMLHCVPLPFLGVGWPISEH